jgi:hypothetical protein
MLPRTRRRRPKNTRMFESKPFRNGKLQRRERWTLHGARPQWTHDNALVSRVARLRGNKPGDGLLWARPFLLLLARRPCPSCGISPCSHRRSGTVTSGGQARHLVIRHRLERRAVSPANVVASLVPAPDRRERDTSRPDTSPHHRVRKLELAQDRTRAFREALHRNARPRPQYVVCPQCPPCRPGRVRRGRTSRSPWPRTTTKPHRTAAWSAFGNASPPWAAP